MFTVWQYLQNLIQLDLSCHLEPFRALSILFYILFFLLSFSCVRSETSSFQHSAAFRHRHLLCITHMLYAVMLCIKCVTHKKSSTKSHLVRSIHHHTICNMIVVIHAICCRLVGIAQFIYYYSYSYCRFRFQSSSFK